MSENSGAGSAAFGTLRPWIAHGTLPKANDTARFPIFIPLYLKYKDRFSLYTMKRHEVRMLRLCANETGKPPVS
jgi:hypothetical protein